MEGLPTKLNLGRRGVNIETKCPLCEKELESTSHALLYCTKLWDVWWSWTTCPINLLAENKEFVEVALLIMYAGTPKDLETLFATAWSIWYNRNRVVHESQCETPAQVWGFAQRIQGDYNGAMTVCQLRKQSPEAGWAAPPPEVYKINVDGATRVGGLSGVGVVIRDCRGLVLVAKSKVMAGSYEAGVTEALAVEEGVLLARERGLHQIIIESNSLEVVQAIRTRSSHGEAGTVVQGILVLLDSFCSWKVQHLKRDYNIVAHELAQMAKGSAESQTWEGVEPTMLQHLLLADRANC
ncbi:hypothetical protein SO802_022981 [Lithocarpus litseifolius]|uniref:RNase H type-1 domain-containing protein n=1 Tax=Lithocarpus litseifolius TaxID=425828 RepID=A0AAW2C5Q2_9ROSI